MDVEPRAGDTGISGPESDEAGMQSIDEFRSILHSAGYGATYFIHPELIDTYPEFFQSLGSGGNALGLHLHTSKFSVEKQPCELGGLGTVDQRRLVDIAATLFESRIGRRPTIFRPGCFSANDATYGVLCDLGFVGGGVSIPGRIWTDRFCVWSGAYPYAHFAHATFRQRIGDLPFVEIPLSVDLTTPLSYNPLGFFHHPDLRPGGMYSATDEVAYDRGKLLHNILRRMATDDPPIKTLVVDVHNDRNFATEESQAAENLKTLLDRIEPECHDLGWDPVSATYEEVIGMRFDAESR